MLRFYCSGKGGQLSGHRSGIHISGLDMRDDQTRDEQGSHEGGQDRQTNIGFTAPRPHGKILKLKIARGEVPGNLTLLDDLAVARPQLTGQEHRVGITV